MYPQKTKSPDSSEFTPLEGTLIILLIFASAALVFCLLNIQEDNDISKFFSSQELFADSYEYCMLTGVARSQEGCEEFALEIVNYIMTE